MALQQHMRVQVTCGDHLLIEHLLFVDSECPVMMMMMMRIIGSDLIRAEDVGPVMCLC